MSAERRRKRRRRPVRCPRCGGTARWRRELGNVSEIVGYPCTTFEGGYVCDGADWVVFERDLADSDLEVDDGRIRAPEDVEPRVEAARRRAATDGRLSELDRAVHTIYCDVARENTSVEIMAADTWVADELGLGERGRTSVRRSRARLEALGYVRRLRMEDVTRHRLQYAVATRSARGLRDATLLEVRKAPPMPECDVCGTEIADGLRVLRRYCSDRCRQAAYRARAEVLAEA